MIRDRESLSGGHVKGAMVRAHVQFVRDRLGEDGVNRTLNLLPPAMSDEIHGVLTSSWYPFESLIRLDRAIARVSGEDPARLMRELGRYSAQINLSTVYRAFRRDDIHDFFRRGATLHRQFQDFGTAEYQQLAPTHGRIRILDATCYSAVYCGSEAGYLEEVIAIHGGTHAEVREPSCMGGGDETCTFELLWR